jgi:transposase
MSLTYHQIKEREEIVEKMIADGKSISQMAKEVGITQQSMHKFLKVRGWKTAFVEGGTRRKRLTPEEEAKKKADGEAIKKLKVKVDRR